MSRQRIRLVGAAELRGLFGGVSRQRAYQISSKPDFPEPLACLTQGKVWDAAEVERWIKTERNAKTKPVVAASSSAAAARGDVATNPAQLHTQHEKPHSTAIRQRQFPADADRRGLAARSRTGSPSKPRNPHADPLPVPSLPPGAHSSQKA